MKNIMSMIALVACVSLVSAQSLKVHTKNSSTPQTFQLLQIDSITFDISSSPVTPPPIPGNLVYPADLLDLTMWELTLPLEEDDATMGTTPKDVYMAITGYSTQKDFLNKYVHDTYFHLNSAKDGVVFRAHAGGATTSGSAYPRSELREMKPGYTTQNTEKASWSTTSGTHTMFIKQAITHLPDVKKHVVAGQIHDASDDLIVIRLEDKKLFVDHGGSEGPILTSNYVLGTVFTVKFVAAGGRVKIFYNGSSTPSDDYPASTSGCYFKAGCYTQSNISKGDAASAYGEVVIYELSVTHN